MGVWGFVGAGGVRILVALQQRSLGSGDTSAETDEEEEEDGGKDGEEEEEEEEAEGGEDVGRRRSGRSGTATGAGTGSIRASTGTSTSLEEKTGTESGLAVGNRDLIPLFRELQSLYVGLVQNPFYLLPGRDGDDERGGGGGGRTKGGLIRSRRFGENVRAVGERWKVGAGG